MVLWFMLFYGCWAPTETGPKGMVGQILSPEGSPIPGIHVNTLEERVVSDQEGRFAIQYKSPEQYIHFMWGKTWFRRPYLEADLGGVVDITLPAFSTVDLVCQYTCDLDLQWQLPGGLEARMRSKCVAGKESEPLTIPTPKSTMSCQRSEAKTEGFVRLNDGVLTVLPPTRRVTVVIAPASAPPKSCEVFIGDTVARKVDELRYVADGTGVMEVTVTCDDIAAPVTEVKVEGEAVEVVVGWMSQI